MSLILNFTWSSTHFKIVKNALKGNTAGVLAFPVINKSN